MYILKLGAVKMTDSRYMVTPLLMTRLRSRRLNPMTKPKPHTLFILTNWGLHRVDPSGIFESHMWLLDENDREMEYVSLHRSKSERAYRGGKILEIRDATDLEIEFHQNMMRENGRDDMSIVGGRKIVIFQMERGWNVLWPKSAVKSQMDYKGAGYINREGKSNA